MQRTLKRECKVLEIAKREAAGPSTCLRSAWASQHRFVLSDIDRREGVAALLRRMSRCYTHGLCDGVDRGEIGLPRC